MELRSAIETELISQGDWVSLHNLFSALKRNGSLSPGEPKKRMNQNLGALVKEGAVLRRSPSGIPEFKSTKRRGSSLEDSSRASNGLSGVRLQSGSPSQSGKPS